MCSGSFNGIYKVDYGAKKTIKNFIIQYDLHCASNNYISMIGSAFLMGTFTGSMFLPQLADLVGRKPIYILGLVVHLISCGGIIISTNRYVLLVLMFFSGISEVGKFFVAYVYAVEILPKTFSNIGGLICFIGMVSAKLLICAYFVFSTDKNWLNLGYNSMLFASISLFITVSTLHESPRFLFDKGEKLKAIGILEQIHRFNGYNP